MGLKLYINYNTFQQLRECDLYPDEGIVIKESLLSTTGLKNATAEFTKEFTIPATGRNNGLLGNYQNKDVVSTVNPNQKIPARIEIDGLKVYYGNVELLSVTWKKGIPYAYSIVFYGSASGLKVDLAQTKLSDIDWSDFEITMTNANIVDTWDNNRINYVPVVSWSRAYRYYSTSSSPVNDNDITVNGVLIDELRVGLRLKDFIEAIATHIGKTITFDSGIGDYLTGAYIIPSATETRVLSKAEFDIDVEGTGLTCPKSSGSRDIIVLPTENVDPSDSWTTSQYYTPTFTGEHIFKIDVSTATASLKEFYCVKNSDNTDVGNSAFAGLDGSTFIYANLVLGTVYRFETINSVLDTDILMDVRLRTYEIPVTLYDKTYDPSLYMPEVFAADFLSDFLKTFNCFITETTSGTYLIKELDRMFDYDNILDLSRYIDQQNLVYEKIDVYKSISMKHEDGPDVGNKDFEDVNNRKYGSYEITPDYDFASEELTIESKFTVFPPNYLYSYDASSDVDGVTDMRHHYQLDDSEPPKPKLSKFIIMYRNGQVNTAYSYLLQSGVDVSGDATFSSMIYYGAYSQVQDYVSTAASNTLCFDTDVPPLGVTPTNGIYEMFWSELIEQMYDNAAYKISVSFKAAYGVYYKLTKNSLIFFRGFYHIISKFQYNTANSMISLELTKLKVKPNVYISGDSENIATEDLDLVITEDSDNIIIE